MKNTTHEISTQNMWTPNKSNTFLKGKQFNKYLNKRNENISPKEAVNNIWEDIIINHQGNIKHKVIYKY